MSIAERARGRPGSPRRTRSRRDTTTKCPSLLGFVQLDLAKVGTYTLTLGPTPVDDFNVVYERTWVVAQ